MRDITRKILDLNLLKPVSVEEFEQSLQSPWLEWDEVDQITLLENEEARLCLRISYESSQKESYCVRLELDELDLDGEVYLNDDVWCFFGSESEAIELIKSKDWGIEALKSCCHFFDEC